MRKYFQINLKDQSVETEELQGEALVQTGRYFIARTLLEQGVAKVEPLSADNPLIFSAGPFAGTNLSNANRLSVGCKSPLTGGVKESNAGGTFAVAMGHLGIAGFTLHDASDDWVVIRIPKEGSISFESAKPYLGKGNIESAAMLHEKYGEKVSVALCGPVGEYQGLLSGIGFTDPDKRPVRLAARGGVGAVMGNKRVKAIVIDKAKMPVMHDRKSMTQGVRAYGAQIREHEGLKNLNLRGTAFMADLTNHIGGLPVNNFSSGRLTDGTLKMGGEYIRQQNLARGGKQSHACMPGCLIECSNVYNNEAGEELVAPLEYETIGLLGTNCGLTEPDDVAELNAIANDLGIDSIETGAVLGVAMEAGVAKFGDMDFLREALTDIALGNERGRLFAQGASRVAEHFCVTRVPVVKKQALSAYDPRVIEVTGISMMVSAQGGDHTVGNVGGYDCFGKSIEELVDVSMQAQISAAAADSMGMCIFGRVVTDAHHELLNNTIHSIHGIEVDPRFVTKLGRETLRLEKMFNREAGFNEEDDTYPDFFYNEPLAPSNKVVRLHTGEVSRCIENWWNENPD
jgi:aldehyde:ferredoxin oxidoreductase